MLRDLDSKVKKNNYSTRTELIRSAIRDKLEKMTRDELIQEFMKFKGKAKIKTTDKEWRKAREQAYKEFVKEQGWD